jgi:hypothetical protein
MVAADEMDPPDPEVWRFAETLLVSFAEFLPPPLVHPLQLGGVSCEWHERGMNIELRVRGLGDVFTVIEDAQNALPNFSARDPDLRHAIRALQVLQSRQT